MADTTLERSRVAPERAHIGASGSPREAAEFVPYPERKARALARDLARSIAGEVRFGDGDRALYATDGSNYRQVPIGVVLPRSIEDVVETMRLCREHGAPYLSRGGGTSLAGQCCNTAVVVDCSKYLRNILSLDAETRAAWVEPGCVLDHLRDTAERDHLTFGPDPSTHDHNTLGGMIGNNSCGVHSVMAGRTVDNVLALDVLTYDGHRMTVGETGEDELRTILAEGGRRAEIYRALDGLRWKYAELIRTRYPRIPRRVSGYSLDELLPENGFHVARALVGSEGTCVAILRAKLRLVPSPPVRVLAVIGFEDIYTAGDAVPALLAQRPVGLEGIDEKLIQFMQVKHLLLEDLQLLPEGCGWLLAEFGADTREEAEAQARTAMRAIARARGHRGSKLVSDVAAQTKIWEVRKAGLGATAFVPGKPEAWEGWEDSAVPPERVGDYLRDLRRLFDKYGYDSALYGHFGDGCIHCRINFGLSTEAGVREWRLFLGEAADLVVRYGGSCSGEHGDGQSKAELLEKMYGPELIQAFREFKRIWDPDGRMNPGKKVDPYPITSNLRLGPDYHPPELQTYFSYPDDGGSFAHAAMRCVGVGECRREKPGQAVMCPSFLGTMEEKHSTRGRGHLLFEMLHGGALTQGWNSTPVEEALDLCLGCKGCKHDCPVNVDMATYKAEFRAHYYRRRLRPRAAYSMGLVPLWARAASLAPDLANLVTAAPGLSALVKRLGGIAPERRMPPFPSETFRQWFARHQPANPHGPKLVLFPDTFNNFFRPATAIAAVRVLEAMGWQVTIPPRVLCCARPLYDWGMLDLAKRWVGRLLDALEPELNRGIKIVGLEPACVASFRDEVPSLFPSDPRAQALKEQAMLLGEFLDAHGQNARLPRLDGKALVQIHCHHHAVLKPDSETRVLERLGLDASLVPKGCCGMAGSFGFETEKYALSKTIAGRTLLPALDEAAPDTMVLADGFSCREQIEQLSGRKTLHLADAVAAAMGFETPELRHHRPERLIAGGAMLALGILAGAALGRRLARA